VKKHFELICFSLLAAFILLICGVFIGRNFGDRNYFISSPQNSSITETHTPTGRLNLNTATAEDLQMIPGIGPVLAERIVTYRQENGDFLAINELKNVQGIGDKTLRSIQDYVYVE